MESKDRVVDRDEVRVWQRQLIEDRYAKRSQRGVPEEVYYQDVIKRVVKTFSVGDSVKESLMLQRIIPASPVLMNAGQTEKVTHFSCFPLGPVDDSTESIKAAVDLAWTIFMCGGGVGVDLSRLRGKGALIRDGHGRSGGPNSFIGVFDAVAGGISQGGRRRGALMVTLDQEHPDLKEFVGRKRLPGVWENMNSAVNVTDWKEFESSGKLDWLCESLWECGDPGLLFIENQTAMSVLMTGELYIDDVGVDHPYWVNPCAEYMAPALTSCNLVSVNLSEVELREVENEAFNACMFANKVIDQGLYPNDTIKARTLKYRPVGVGVTGLHIRMIQDGVRYGSSEGVEYAREVQRRVLMGSVKASIKLAEFDTALDVRCRDLLDDDRVVGLLEKTNYTDLIDGYLDFGMANCVTTVQAPAGSISQLVGCWSTGIEPVFSRKIQRRYRGESGELDQVVEIEVDGVRDGDTAIEMNPFRQVDVMAAMQELCHSAISKTVNVPNTYTVDEVKEIVRYGYKAGLKSITVFRNGCKGESGQVLSRVSSGEESSDRVLPTTRDGQIVTIEGLINCHTILTDYDLFVIAGKGGSLLHSSFEALGRVVSLLLQKTPELHVAVARTLRGIDCGSVFRIPGVDRMFKSIPDAVAFLLDKGGEGESLADNGWLDICPKCGTGNLRRVGGCNTCEQCGYSTC